MRLLKKPSKKELILSFLILVWVVAIMTITPMLTTIPTWPMFFVTICFFLMGADFKQIPSIFIGGTIGLGATFLMLPALSATTPILGDIGALVLVLLVILGVIIIGSSICPLLFNNVGFAYLTIAAIRMEEVPTMTGPWLLMLLIGGTVILGGIIILILLVEKLFPTDILTPVLEKD